MLLSGAAGSERGGCSGGAGAGGAPQCVGTMARWLREHLGFRSARPAPPAPPKPDYRAGPPPQPPLPPGGAAEPLAAAQPDIVAAYRLQKERDFEDPYSGAPPAAAPDGARYVSPKHRLIKVEAVEKVPASPPVPVPPISPPTGPEPPDDPPQELAVLEDYADPFDAAHVSGSQAGLEKVMENDGYMEPYEAQKMMAEIRQKGLREAPARPLHLYDTPYEPVLDMDSDCPACPRPRESRLPEDDERPPEEYDQPWEWKKERISKAFAVEIKVIKDLPWPPPVGQLDSSESPLDGEAGVPVPLQHSQHSYEDANGRNKTSSAVSGSQILAERSNREGSAQRMPRQPSVSRMQKAGTSGKNSGGGNST
ncbi:SH2 domain-containing adapter protein D-like isoform 5-T6 [Acridotheres tristis]